MEGQGRKFSQVKIDLPNEVLSYSVKDIAGDVLFQESVKPLKVVKSVHDLPNRRIISLFD